MKSFIKAIDELPFIVKLILALPALDIVYAIYRIAVGIDRNQTKNLVLGIIWLVFGSYTIFWLLDLIFVLMKKPVFLLD